MTRAPCCDVLNQQVANLTAGTASDFTPSAIQQRVLQAVTGAGAGTGTAPVVTSSTLIDISFATKPVDTYGGIQGQLTSCVDKCLEAAC